MSNTLVKLLGWKATVLHGDPCVYDRWRWLRRHLSPGPVRTLDVGCGSGAFTMYAAQIGNQCLGISFDDANNRKARERARMLGISGVEFFNADLRSLPQHGFELASFDQIICLETIEHIQEDAKFIEDVSRLLKPGGRLLLTTPFKHYRRLYGDTLSDGTDGGHVRWGYTHEELRELMAPNGIDVVREEYICGFVAQQLTNMMRLIGKINFGFAWSAILPLRLFQSIDRPLTAVMHYPCLSVAVVGIKRLFPQPADSR
jgi:SAM-dependent methyltransferase